VKQSVANGQVRVGVAGTSRDGRMLPFGPNALSVVHGEGRARFVRERT